VEVTEIVVEATELIGKCIIGVFGFFLMALGAVAFVRPKVFQSFLSGFAQNAPIHFLEMAFRFIVGVAFLGCASLLNYGYVFQAFGWVLVVTTAVLLFVPWKIHRKFAVLVVPRALEYTRFMGGTAMVMGAFVVFSLLGGGEI